MHVAHIAICSLANFLPILLKINSKITYLRCILTLLNLHINSWIRRYCAFGILINLGWLYLFPNLSTLIIIARAICDNIASRDPY